MDGYVMKVRRLSSSFYLTSHPSEDLRELCAKLFQELSEAALGTSNEIKKEKSGIGFLFFIKYQVQT